MAERRTLHGDGFSMDYAVFGEGKRPFVILPGMSLHPVTPMAELIADIYADFARRYRCYLFDRRSEMPDDYSVRDMARDTAQAMKQLSLADADLFGASQGGMIAECIALDEPQLVRRLALGSTLARQNEVSRDTFTLWDELSRRRDAVALNRSVAERVYSAERRERDRDAFAAMENDGTEEELRSFGVLSRASLGFDVYDELDGISCPTLVLGAEEDRVLSVIGSREIAERLPSCELFVYERAAHAVYDEAPDYCGRLLSFFEA